MKDQEQSVTALTKTYVSIVASTSLIGLLGNTLVLLVYLKHMKQLSTCKILIAHLAACDCLFSLMQLCLILPSITSKAGWYMGLTACRFFRVSYLSGGLIAIETITFISVYRYLEVFKPAIAMKTKKNLKFVLGLAWLCGIISAMPVAVFARIDDTSAVSKECTELSPYFKFRKEQQAFNIYLMLIFCILPITIIYFTYGRIVSFLTMHNQSKQSDNFRNIDDCDDEVSDNLRNVEDRNDEMGRNDEMCSSEEDQMNLNKEDISVAAFVVEDLTITKILKFVVVMFFICVIPARIMGIVISFVDIPKLAQLDFLAIAYAGLIPYPFHVAINPFIYSFMDEQFRRNIWRLLSCKKKRKNRHLHMETVTDEIPFSFFSHEDEDL